MSEGALSNLYALADGDTGFVVEILDLMQKNIPIDIADIEKSVDERNLLKVKRSAHHMKSSIQYSNEQELIMLLEKIDNKDFTSVLEAKSLLPKIKELSDKLMKLIEAEKQKLA